MPKVQTHLWFESQAEEAVAFYRSIFKDSKILRSVDLPDPELSRIEFEIAGQPMVALNAHAHAPYNEASHFWSRPKTRKRPTITGRHSPPMAARSSPAAG